MAQLSWQFTVTTSGTAVQGDASPPGTFQIQAGSGNTGTLCYAGNDGTNDVDDSTGYTLKKAGVPVIITVTSLAELWFDSDTNGDKIEVLKLQGDNTRYYPRADDGTS